MCDVEDKCFRASGIRLTKEQSKSRTRKGKLHLLKIKIESLITKPFRIQTSPTCT